MAEAAELSKSAKRRAAKKARDAAHPAEAAPAAPETTPEKPKAKAAAKAPAAEPKAKPKEAAKAAAKPKAAPKEEPKKPDPKAAAKSKAKAAPEAAKPKEAPKAKADPKAKAGAAKAKAKAEPAPPPPAPEPAPKAKGKAKAAPEPKSSPPKAAAKSKAGAPQKKEEDTAAPERVEVVQPFEVDDGTGGEWEQSTGLSKKAEKRKEKQEMMKKEAKGKDQKLIPGMAPINTVPGMAPPKAASKEEIAAFIARAAEKGTAARTAEEEKQAAANALHTQTIKVPENKIGIVIGPKGSKIKMIQEKTGVARIDTSGEIFTIAGPQQAVEMAYAAIKELIEKGYCAMAFEDFKEEGVMVHPSVYPDIIGKGGVTIKAFKTELNVEVTIPEVPKNATGTKKYKVTLAGKADDVRRAKEVLTSIMKYGHHEVTHPDQTHEEMEVEEWAYKFLIGKAGSELRHIQNNYKVKVNIPRPHSECQNVVIVGGVGDVSRAKDYIDNLMWKAQNQPAGGRGQDAAIDPWGEEEEEDWMKAYIYKR